MSTCRLDKYPSTTRILHKAALSSDWSRLDLSPGNYYFGQTIHIRVAKALAVALLINTPSTVRPRPPPRTKTVGIYLDVLP